MARLVDNARELPGCRKRERWRKNFGGGNFDFLVVELRV